MRLIVTSGYERSMHVIALIHELIENGHDVIGCIQIKTFQIKRLKGYINLYGWSTVKAKFKSHFLKIENTYLFNETKPIKQYLRQKGISERRTSAYCKYNKIKLIRVNSINDINVEYFITNNNIDLVLYSGGGIIKKNILNKSRYGVLNSHSGWLPFFRGMNAIEWSLLYGFMPHTTIHLIDEGIDTGQILLREPIPIDRDLYTTRGNATVHNIKLLINVVNNFTGYYNNKYVQQKSEGKQFFVMHNRLKCLVSKYLKNNSILIDLTYNIDSSDELRFK